MDLQQNYKSPVLGDHVPPLNNSTLGLSTNLLPSGRIPTVTIKKLIPGKVDNGPGSVWIDAMKSSSPPRGNRNQEEKDSAYSTWVVKYPSALTSFDQIIDHAKAKKIALFLDYDGTLSPIVDNPDRAFMSNSMRAAVRSVAECFPTAIISGRSRDKVFKFIGLTELYYAGSHGMDIMGPLEKADQVNGHPNYSRLTNRQGKALQMFQPASKFMPTIKEVFRSLVESIKSINGAMVENNKFCVSVHYRLVEEKNWPIVAQIVKDILEKHPNLRLTHGRKVLEVRPVIDWDKGKAVEFLLESLGYNCLDYVLPIYIGDDRTDEDAFKVLRERNCGYGILVSSTPKISSAFYSLRDPSEVREFLESLVKWKKSTSSG